MNKIDCDRKFKIGRSIKNGLRGSDPRSPLSSAPGIWTNPSATQTSPPSGSKLETKIPTDTKEFTCVKRPKRQLHTQTGEAGKVCKSEYHLRTGWQPGFFKTAADIRELF
jgi:hypothetical protein